MVVSKVCRGTVTFHLPSSRLHLPAAVGRIRQARVSKRENGVHILGRCIHLKLLALKKLTAKNQ